MNTLESLQHTELEIPGGGRIVVLNTGAIIDPEAEAMLQALHSRSVGGIKNHLKVLASKGPEKFLSTFYVGYGHKSIGDCGTCTIFIEGVSMLAAKAIQDWSLYSGQEASTRYIDFATQVFKNPTRTTKGEKILEDWRSFYLKGLKDLEAHLMERFPRQDGENEKIHHKAIKARSFDIMRGFLPSGATTNLAWHTNLRQAADHLMRLRHHPLAEVRAIGETLEKALEKAFPSSFGHKRYEATEKYNEEWMRNNYYYSEETPSEFILTRNDIDRDALEKYKEALLARPPKTEVPRELAECGTLQFQFLLDFGSYRDIQRHRAVRQSMPLVTTDHGFEPWYLNELPSNLQIEAKALLSAQEATIKDLGLSPEDAQYYIAMGYRLPNKVTGNIPALVYLVELRATRFVHPTLRVRARQMAEVLEKEFKAEGVILHLDSDPDRFDIKRGEHDIVAKEE